MRSHHDALLALALLVSAPASAQTTAAPLAEPAEPAADAAEGLQYSIVDRATVRVFAVHGVGTARISSASGVDRLLAVPETSHGSGVLLDGGIVLTARHVVDDASLLAVWVPGEDSAYPATVLHTSEEDDFAFLAIGGGDEPRGSMRLPSSSPALRIRQTVHAVGYPLDARRTSPQSSRGIISGTLPNGYLQLDMALNPGNSGGPLIDEHEELVGLVVARGDPNRGVQGIGIAVPLAPIRVAHAEHVASRTVTAEPSDSPRTREVAELVTLLAQVGATELIQEVIEVVDNHRQGQVLPRLISLAESTQDPQVLALTAAYFWDVAAVILERAGGFMRASQLPDGPQRTLARQLLGRSIDLCRRVGQADPTLAARSPFVAHVLHYLAGADTSGSVPGVAMPAPAPPPPAATASVTPPPPEAPRERQHRWFALRFGLGLPTQPAAGFGIDGFVAAVSAVVRPWIGRIGPLGFAPQLVIDTALGAWGQSGVADIQVQLGAQLRLGDETIGFVAEGAWAPSGVVVASHSGFDVAGWAAAAGLHYDQVAFYASWRGTNVPGYFSIHLFQVLFEVTP